MLRDVLDVLPPSVCSIFRSGPFGTLSTMVGGKELDYNAVNAVILLLPPCCWVTAVSAAGSGNFCVAEGGRSQTPNSKSSSKFVFFLPASGPPLLSSPVLLELSSLHEPWSVDTLSEVFSRKALWRCFISARKCFVWQMVQALSARFFIIPLFLAGMMIGDFMQISVSMCLFSIDFVMIWKFYQILNIT